MLQWARYARVIRGEVLSLKERDFIAQARIAGCSAFRILLVHLFPNVLNILVVMVTIEIGIRLKSDHGSKFCVKVGDVTDLEPVLEKVLRDIQLSLYQRVSN